MGKDITLHGEVAGAQYWIVKSNMKDAIREYKVLKAFSEKKVSDA